MSTRAFSGSVERGFTPVGSFIAWVYGGGGGAAAEDDASMGAGSSITMSKYRID